MLKKFKEFNALVKNRKNEIMNLNIIRSDNGGEYVSQEFAEYCQSEGIVRQFTNPTCPEQNGVSERLNRTLMEGARAILYHAKLPLKFWAEAVSTMTYIRNRSPTSALDGATPHEYWFGVKPNISNLRVFGCICYVHIPDSQRKKLEQKSYKAIFMGYPDGTKGFKVFNPITEKFARSCNVIFREQTFYDFSEKMEKIDDAIFFPAINSNDFLDDKCDESSVGVEKKDIVDDVNVQCDKILSSGHCEEKMNKRKKVTFSEVLVESDPLEFIDDNNDQGTDNMNNSPGTGNMNNSPGIIVGTDNTNNSPGNDDKKCVGKTYEETFMNQVANLNLKRSIKPRERLVESQLVLDDSCLLSLTSELGEPKTYKEAIEVNDCEKWCHAMDDEFNSLMLNKTWELVPRPDNQKVIGCKWIYKIKRGPNGEISRYKARLVAKGFLQTEGVDFQEVFAPVAHRTTIRALLSFANTYNYEVHQMDIKTAFLHGLIECDLYMEQPEGYINQGKRDYVCKLKNGLCG